MRLGYIGSLGDLPTDTAGLIELLKNTNDADLAMLARGLDPEDGNGARVPASVSSLAKKEQNRRAAGGHGSNSSSNTNLYIAGGVLLLGLVWFSRRGGQ